MNYKDPQGKKITLTMSRIRATGSHEGVIFANPGGPGGSALGLWEWILKIGSATPLRAKYDLIAVQPRGLLNGSISLPCQNDDSVNAYIKKEINKYEALEKELAKRAQKRRERADKRARAAAEDNSVAARSKRNLEELNDKKEALQDEYTKASAEQKKEADRRRELFNGSENNKDNDQCVKESEEYSRTITTENTARDFDMARQYLGEKVIHYYGASYGTYLGAVYLTLFPKSSGRFVLDSAVNPEWVWYKGFEAQSPMQRKRIYEMFQFIADHDDIYHLGNTPLAVYERWYTMLNSELNANAAIPAPPAQIGDVPPEYRFHAKDYLESYNTVRPISDRVNNMLRAWVVPPIGALRQKDKLWDVTTSGYTSRRKWPALAYYLQHGSLGKSNDDPMEYFNELSMGMVFRNVVCNENTYPAKPLGVLKSAQEYFTGGDIFDVTSGLVTSGALCLGINSLHTPVTVRAHKWAVRPLVLQSLNDTQTVYEEGGALASILKAHFVTVEGGDHGVYVQYSPEAWALINNYLMGKGEVTQTHLPYAQVKNLLYTPK